MSLSQLSSAANPIDLTLDDANSSDDEYTRSAKRPRMDSSTVNLQPSFSSYRPPFAGPSTSSAFFPDRHLTQKQQHNFRPFVVQQPARQIIDLTGSTPSPPPPQSRLRSLPPDTPPKVPVCIGQLLVTALVLYPVPYLVQSHPDDIWAPVRLQYEQAPNHQGGSETIHIRTPPSRGSNGGQIDGDNFAVVEQKVVNAIGGMLGRGLIRLDAKIRKGHPNVPILPLQMLVYTPKGNIQPVGNYLQQYGLLLEDPAPPYDAPRLSHYFYFNPHNPANGLINLHMLPTHHTQWTPPAVSGKSVEVQRSQVDELFKSLRDGDDLQETEGPPEIATKLYPHQKKALTFLLERERERPGPDGRFSSLWQPKTNPMTNKPYWFNVVTQTETSTEPDDPKGSILADDMGLGKTITCVSLIAATLPSARAFAALPLDKVDPPSPAPSSSHFAGSVWGMPQNGLSAKAQAKAQRAQERLEADYARACRIKTRSRATLIICPLSTVANWEEQFRDHWKGPVHSVGGSSGCSAAPSSSLQTLDDTKLVPSAKVRSGTPIKVYVYHGNARRPEPAFLADFDAVITTYATLASEFSKQNRSKTSAEAEDDEEISDGIAEVDQHGIPIPKMPKPKKTSKRKLTSNIVSNAVEATSALQSVMWFRIVLDEAHCIKETQTVGSRASCDLMADRRLCLTGTPVQNKLDDVYALVKFLRLAPLDEKASWTEHIGGPVKFGQDLGIARLQALMKCITLRRTKETEDQTGKKILSLPPRRDELRWLQFDPQEQAIYNRFFSESKAEFNEMSSKNEVMRNYVGILQKILRLRQICDHFELVRGKGPQELASYEDIVAEIEREGFDPARAMTIFTILREAAPIQCVECNSELCTAGEADKEDCEAEGTPKSKKRGKNTSRAPTRASSPSVPKIILTRCQHVFCIQCYQNSVCPNWPDVPPDVQTSCSACQMGLFPSDAVEIKPDLDTSKKKPQKRDKRPKGLPLDNFQPSTKIKALLGDLVGFSRMNPCSVNYDPSSVEVQMIDDKGNQLDDGIIKTVVFSQWTTMLDKIEDALETAGIRYDRLDGTMKRDDRTRAIDALKHDPACEVLLVSLKAGGVGLNLTAAQRVYIMDPYWNPAVENQAVDRIHRLGQTRPVTTVKLIIENSIEARLLEVQKKKTALANMTLGNNYTKAELQARRLEELQQLFQDT